MKLALSNSLTTSNSALATFVGALDGYTSGLAVCWDLRRRLLSSYTGALFQVRADRTGQPTFDVPYKADGTWDTAALLSFAGSDSCYMVQAYAQYGSFQFVQATAASQPRIVNVGVLEANGGRFDIAQSLNATLNASDFTGGGGTTVQVITNLFQSAADIGYGLWNYNGSQSGCYVKFPGNGILSDLPGAARTIVNPSGWDDAAHILSQERNGATSIVRLDGSVITTNAGASGSVSGTAAELVVGVYGASFSGWISSQIIWSDTTDAAGRAAALA